jgi:hypothetical protein
MHRVGLLAEFVLFHANETRNLTLPGYSAFVSDLHPDIDKEQWEST